jgi:hypothetical protein
MRFLFCFYLFSLWLLGCNLTETNLSPNDPVAVPMEVLLPPAQRGLADVLGGDIFIYTNIFSQHMQGTFRQPALAETYNPDETFVGNLWNDLYNRPMINCAEMIRLAEETGSPHYAGVARVIMALSLGTLTSIWGDVPYREALQGGEAPDPAFDSQEQIYQTLQQLLDQAIIDLAMDDSNLSPDADDVIYGGDLVAWTRAAYAIKARYALHLTAVQGDAAAQAALAALANGLSSSDQDLTYAYQGTQADANPIYQFFNITPDALADPQFLARLTDDPRRPYLIARRPFSSDDIVGPYLASIGSPLPLMTYVEQRFIEAEASLRLGQSADAQSALRAAITASMQQVSDGDISPETIDAYLDAKATLGGTFEADLARIIEEKYIALFTQTEPWTDYRRSGYPALLPNPNGDNANNPGGGIPLRLSYPQTERLQNSQVPTPVPNLQVPLWWDR